MKRRARKRVSGPDRPDRPARVRRAERHAAGHGRGEGPASADDACNPVPAPLPCVPKSPESISFFGPGRGQYTLRIREPQGDGLGARVPDSSAGDA